MKHLSVTEIAKKSGIYQSEVLEIIVLMDEWMVLFL